MEILALVGILYFLLGASICLLICVNPNDPGILGKMRKFFFTTLPSSFRYYFINPAKSSREYLESEF